MTAPTLRILERGSGRIVEAPLGLASAPGRCSLRLRVLPGAEGLHLAFSREGQVVQRVEVPAAAEETVRINVESTENGELAVASPGRPVLTLPPDERFEPCPPLLPTSPGAGLDLAILVDGTTRSYRQEGARAEGSGGQGKPDGPIVAEFLLGTAEDGPWPRLAEEVVGLAGRLAEGEGTCRVAVLAFGDRRPPFASAPDLIPSYRLHPPQAGDRRFRPVDPDRLRVELLELPPTSGGDFVDALADALAACARLPWRSEARKLLLLLGDSPGHSILHPPPHGTSTGARRRDVDLEAVHLHGKGVELASIFFAQAPALGLHQVDFRRRSLDFARSQYTRLASLPRYSFEARSFTAKEAIRALSHRDGPIGCGATLGELVENLSVDVERAALPEGSPLPMRS
jgi:hypothetical protein